MCDKFYGIRPIYYIYDKYNLLKDKESPADANNKIFNYLFKYKVKYDEKERREYLSWLEKQEKN
jgi:DNA primase